MRCGLSLFTAFLLKGLSLARLCDSRGQHHLRDLPTTMRPYGREGKRRRVVKKEVAAEATTADNREGKIEKQRDSES